MKINKHLFIFSSLLLLLVLSYFFVLMKFFPILIHHTIYYCREMAKAISLNLPGNWGIVVFGILIISALSAGFRLLATAVRVDKFRQMLSRARVKEHRLFRILESLKLTGKVVVLREDRPFAYCFGIRKPSIYVTTGLVALVDDNELKMILRHEKYHLDNHDNLILLVAIFVKSLFPFFPLLTDLIRIYKTDRELLADQAALRRKSDKRVLSSILKKLLQCESETIPAFAPAIVEAETLETRIKSLHSMKVNYRHLGRRNIIFSLVFVAGLMALVGTPIDAVERHDDGPETMIVCDDNSTCKSICRDLGLIKSQGTTFSKAPMNFSAPIVY